MLSFIAAEAPHTGTHVEDHHLLEAYRRQHDREALSELFRRYTDLCYRVAILIVNDPALAETSVKDAFQRIVEDATLGEGQVHIRAWVLSYVIQSARKRKAAEYPTRSHKRSHMQVGAAAATTNSARM